MGLTEDEVHLNDDATLDQWYAGDTGGMYVICIWGCATDGGFGKTHNFEKIVSRVTISYL